MAQPQSNGKKIRSYCLVSKEQGLEINIHNPLLIF